jgi:hypothetical protein
MPPRERTRQCERRTPCAASSGAGRGVPPSGALDDDTLPGAHPLEIPAIGIHKCVVGARRSLGASAAHEAGMLLQRIIFFRTVAPASTLTPSTGFIRAGLCGVKRAMPAAASKRRGRNCARTALTDLRHQSAHGRPLNARAAELQRARKFVSSGAARSASRSSRHRSA